MVASTKSVRYLAVARLDLEYSLDGNYIKINILKKATHDSNSNGDMHNFQTQIQGNFWHHDSYNSMPFRNIKFFRIKTIRFVLNCSIPPPPPWTRIAMVSMNSKFSIGYLFRTALNKLNLTTCLE